jgi:hypothetical protein
MAHETDPRTRTIEALMECARKAAGLQTLAGLALAARLHLKAWELEHGEAAEAPHDDMTGLLDWAAAERARPEETQP